MRRAILLMTLMLVGITHGNKPAPTFSTNAQAVVQGSTAFACDLYKRLGTAEGNMFFSPYSIACALGLSYAGARGETAKQIANVLRLPDNETNVHRAYAEIQRRVGAIGLSRNVRLTSANGLWTRKGKAFLPSFLSIASKAYRAEPQQLDFGGAPRKSCDVINDWVAERTCGRIPRIIDSSIINSNTALILVNAVYFHGAWETKFGSRFTVPRAFKMTKDKAVHVPTMTQETDMYYAEDSECQILEMPYAGDDVAMVIVLPRNIDGLAAIEAKLSSETLEKWFGAMTSKLVKLYLPKFTMENGVPLPATLSAMGMTDAFVFGRANFSGMDGTNLLYIYDAQHRARVVVNEDGTEAEGVTLFDGCLGEESSPPEPVVFRADHPFLFFIRDRETGGIYFMGRMANPQ